jgi:inorganic pyrophosphatase
MVTHSLVQISAFDVSLDEVNVIIDTPKGSRNKFKYDAARGLFKLGGVLPAGALFPYDFGFLPSTLGGDGDPLDVLVLLDEPTFVGCLVPARLIGVIEADQTEAGHTERNDRLIAVAIDSRVHRGVHALEQVSAALVEEIEHFFISYNAVREKQFTPRGRGGPMQARRIIEEGMVCFQRAATSDKEKH